MRTNFMIEINYGCEHIQFSSVKSNTNGALISFHSLRRNMKQPKTMAGNGFLFMKMKRNEKRLHLVNKASFFFFFFVFVE